MMKILLYYEPSMFGDGFLGTSSYKMIVDHLLGFTAKCLIGRPEAEFRAVVSEAAAFRNAETHVLDPLNPVVVTDDEVFAVAGGGSTMQTLFFKMFHQRLSAEEARRYAGFIRRKLGAWEPDVIVTFPVHNDYLKRIYPRALVLNNENGMLSRKPFPRCLRYEPMGYVRSFTNAYAREIGAFPVPDRMAGRVEEFRRAVQASVDRINVMQRNFMSEQKRRFRHLVLLPVIWGNEYEECEYDDDFSFFNGVLSSLPRDVGVVVTRHDNTGGKLNDNTLPYLREKFPNVIFPTDCESGIGKYSSQSLNYFGSVDAVLNCMTTTGLQATLWNTRVIALDRHYSHWFADSIGLGGLEDSMSAPVRDRTSLLYWYFTHYAVFPHRYEDGDWMYRFLSEKLEHFRAHGVTFDLFGQIEDFGEIADRVIRHVEDSVESYYARAVHDVELMRKKGRGWRKRAIWLGETLSRAGSSLIALADR